METRIAESLEGVLRARSKRNRTASTKAAPHSGEDTEMSDATPRPAMARMASAPLVPTTSNLGHDPQLLTVESVSDGFGFHRGSVTSIRDDPFFRNYQTPQSVSMSRELSTNSNRAAQQDGNDEDEDEDEDDVMEIPLRSSERHTVDTSVNLPPQSRSGMSDINIAVIGASGVGKSTLIQKAFGMRSLPGTTASSQRMSVDNVVYTVSMIELDLESFDIQQDRRIQWPKQVNGHIVPRLDGVLLLYDVMNRESIVDLPSTLNGLVNSYLPTILVSCKCDNPENARQIEVTGVEEMCRPMGCVDAVKTAINVPETARQSLGAMLRAVMANRKSPNMMAEKLAGRRRATSSAILDPPNDPTRPLSPNSNKTNHSRANSEYSIGRGFVPQTPASSRQPSRPNGRTNVHQNFTLPDPHEAPPLSSHPAFRHDSFQAQPLEPASSVTFAQRPHSPTSPSTAGPFGKVGDNSFLHLDMDESDAESTYRYSNDTDTPILQREDSTFFDKPAKVAGVTFDELVDRLLGQNLSRADNNFSDIFLCLYRKFAAPGELFGAIMSRLEGTANDSNAHYLTRTTVQFRIIGVIAKWVTTYPGDFASPSTSAKLEAFITTLAGEPEFSAAADDMRTQLQSRVFEDDDTGWARTDADVEIEAGNTAESAPTSPVRTRTASTPLNFEDEMEALTVDEDGTDLERKETHDSSGRAPSPTPSFHSYEDYEREAATMVPRSNLPLTKFRYHIFMDLADDDFADEITRIDWVMFSSIRLRDLVRHVSLPLQQKEKCKSLANVNRMIAHFNHVARWVANMILMRDKAKHRALMLEKFMLIALKLRQLNNYNGLAAVLAGINGSAIHRLAQTRALVPAEVQKRFARLVILMGTQKSHFAYRLAWENSPLPRIPFIPLHRRDLVSAEEGSRTFVGANGERINWKKFEVLSEVILPIMKSQVVPYPNLTRLESARELILDCKMPVDEEEVYQRSLELESSSGAVEFTKKKFPWFQKEK